MTTLSRKFKTFRRFEDYIYRFFLLQFYLLFQPKNYLIISPYHNLYLPFSKKKYVTTIHDLVFIEKPEFFSGLSFTLNKFLLKWSLNNSKVIITVSEDTKKRIEKISCKTDIHIVYNSYPTLFYHYEIPALIKIDNPYIFYFGGVDPRKDLSLMFKIYEKYKTVAKGKLNLVCTKLRKDYEIFLDNTHHLGENIEFLGEITSENLVNKIVNSEAIFYLSDYEGFGRPVMEATAFNKSVIVKNLDVFKEIRNAQTLFVDNVESGIKVLLHIEKNIVVKHNVEIVLDQKFLLSSNKLKFHNVIKQYI